MGGVLSKYVMFSRCFVGVVIGWFSVGGGCLVSVLFLVEFVSCVLGKVIEFFVFKCIVVEVCCGGRGSFYR